MKTRMFPRAAAAAFSLALAALAAAPGAGDLPQVEDRPRLVVVISIDQFRADYLTRFADLYLPPDRGRGFRFLARRGAWYPDCRYQHSRLVTGVGHAVLSTGAQPSVHGIVGNNWFDRKAGARRYCTDDDSVRAVGAAPDDPEGKMSPRSLLTTTVVDELETATGGESATVSVSLKDRAAILLSGHRTDEAVWIHDAHEKWISSSFYCPDGRLPAWAEEANRGNAPARLKAAPWRPGVDAAALRRAAAPGREVLFSHPLSGAGALSFAYSPGGNQMVLETALAAVRARRLGQDDVPDLLAVNLASNDYAGHKFGPDSPEVLDISVQTDRQLSAFFGELEKLVPGGWARLTVAISADHGVAPVPEFQRAARLPAGRLDFAALGRKVEAALKSRIGAGDWVQSTENDEIYLREATLARYPQWKRGDVEALAVEALRGEPGVLQVLGKSAVLAGQVPATRFGRRLAATVHPERSGDILVLPESQWIGGAGRAMPYPGTTHGTPYAYDTHVPLLLVGTGIRPGTRQEPVTPAQLAPTLAHLLGVARPSGADEPLLPGLTR